MGKSLAWVELRLVLCRLLWNFNFNNEGLEKVRFDDFPMIMLVQKNKLSLNIMLRNR
jgi:hypothetical protein